MPYQNGLFIFDFWLHENIIIFLFLLLFKYINFYLFQLPLKQLLIIIFFNALSLKKKHKKEQNNCLENDFYYLL